MTRCSESVGRDLFDKCGYSAICEFVRISDAKRGKFIARCKTCGYEFERDCNILRKPQKKLRCPECHERKINRALYYYQAGHSRHECAEMFDLTHAQVMNYAKKYRIRGGMSKDRLAEYARESQERATARSAELARERSEITKNDKRIRRGFMALSREVDGWRSKLDTVTDDETHRLHRAFDKSDRRIEEIEAYAPKIATCKHCGKEWLFWPSREKWGRRVPPVFCSNKCNYKHYKTGTIADRLRRYGRADEHRECIPLDDVIERDNGICYLCGCKTDKADSWYDVNGYFVCGDTYPTRDHVIPIAKGGTHTWDNVRLACRKCNSIKNEIGRAHV